MITPPEKLKLDILVFGYEKDKEYLKDFFAKLQGQLDKLNRTDIGVLFGLANEEEDSLDKVKNHLTTMVAAPNYVFLDATEIKFILPNYIENLARLLDNDAPFSEDLREFHGFKKI
tara:strand:- start:340 stop:687 length:348 start_codon:yes stop_codon:yes gene_type:complete